MKVTYTPPLLEQIRDRPTPRPSRLVSIRKNGQFVEEVDPITRQTTGVPKRFVLTDPDGTLQPTDQIGDVEIIDVDSITYR